MGIRLRCQTDYHFWFVCRRRYLRRVLEWYNKHFIILLLVTLEKLSFQHVVVDYQRQYTWRVSDECVSREGVSARCNIARWIGTDSKKERERGRKIEVTSWILPRRKFADIVLALFVLPYLSPEQFHERASFGSHWRKTRAYRQYDTMYV